MSKSTNKAAATPKPDDLPAQVAPPAATAMTTRHELPLGLAARDSSDDDGAQVPAIAIAQPASTKKPDDVPPGVFYVPLTGESLGPKVLFVPIAQFFTRGYWRKQADGEQQDATPVCSSIDGLFPRSGESPPQSNGGTVEVCAACQCKEWRSDPNDKKSRIAPLCSRSINYFGVFKSDIGGTRTGRIGFKRTSYRCGQDIEAVMRAAFPPRALWGTVYELSLTEVKKPTQRYFIAKQRVIGLTAEKFTEAFAGAEQMFKSWTEEKASRVAHEAAQDEAPDDEDRSAPRSSGKSEDEIPF